MLTRLLCKLAFVPKCVVAAGIATASAAAQSPAKLGDELFKLTASDAADFDSDTFGWSVGINGDKAIVGAPSDDDNGAQSGSAYLYDVSTGQEVFKLTASDAAALDYFGRSVALSGNTAIVGAPLDLFPHRGFGSAYLFDATTGDERFKLTASDAAAFGAAADLFGESVAISGNVALVGAPANSHAGGGSAGAAYLFDVTTGREISKLTASDSGGLDQFGTSVAISGDLAIVGAPFSDDAGIASGSAYLFDVSDPLNPIEILKLTAADATEGDQFGRSVAVSGNTAIVGVPKHYIGFRPGSAYLFDVNTGQAFFKLSASDATEGDAFGLSVDISGNTAIVGALTSRDGGIASGSAYLFDVTTGEELTKLTASDAAAFDNFGNSVAISGNTALVGAYHDDNYSGSAYLFSAVPEPATFALWGIGCAALTCFAARRGRLRMITLSQTP